MSSIFGGSKQKSSSANQAYGGINSAFSPLYSNAAEGSNALSALLGGDASGLNRFKAMTGYDAAAEQGSRGITGNAAAGGLLRSGSTAKALTSYGAGLNNQFANNYMDRLLAQAGLGFQAGNLVGGAGQTSTSSGKSNEGMGGFLGSMIGAVAASDRRLKKNIHKVGELSNGLTIYQYRYIDNDQKVQLGVMADEVKRLIPDALGPLTSDGYMTVDYSKLNQLQGVV